MAEFNMGGDDEFVNMPVNTKKKRTHTIVRTVMQPLILLVIAEVLLLLSVFGFNDVVGQLDNNSEDILIKQIQSRSSYLNSQMLDWSDLAKLAETINNTAASMFDSGKISIDELDSNSEVCSPLLLEITDDLISTLYAKRVSGIYVIFNTQDINKLRADEQIPDKTGIYIRDMDPDSQPSLRNEDLLLGRAPTSVCRELNIANESCWKPRFSFSQVSDPDDYAYFTKPMKEAFAADFVNDASDYGYWSPSCHTLAGSDMTAITYSIPLVLEDGTIYGVLGIDILDDYLVSLLPYNELISDDSGAYFVHSKLASEDDPAHAEPFLCSGAGFDKKPESLKLTERDGGYTFDYNGRNYFSYFVTLRLYSNNGPFESEHWEIIGAVPSKDLYRFSNRMIIIFIIDIAAMLVLGIIGSIIIGRRVSTPIEELSSEVARARSANVIPHLPVTGIKELDGFSHAFTSLSRDVIRSSTRFLQIIHLASFELGGYEINNIENTVYVTDNFFSMLGRDDVDISHLTVKGFEEITAELTLNNFFSNEPDGSFVYKVIGDDYRDRYIRVNRTVVDNRQVGVAEDITSSTRQRLRVEHERDHDLLTGLINRRAFNEKVSELFQTPERLRYAAIVMLDTDSLKHINDNYGHDYGDKYLRQVAQCLVDASPVGTICSRVSGDEFYALFYGYKTEAEVRRVVANLATVLKNEVFEAAAGIEMPLSVSAGVAWYPRDSTDMMQLMKYADFAMFCVKKSNKGSIKEFDIVAYNDQSFLIDAKKEFVQFISGERLFYFFQPIISTVDGSIFAYEALMRTDLPSLRSIETIMQIARNDGRLQEIENLTWLKAPAYYRALLDQGKVSKDCYLFLNSLGNQLMSKEVERKFVSEFSDLVPKIVTEITESDEMDSYIISEKLRIDGSGLFALDDFGSGYNGERNLLLLSPKFIKIDMSIVRDIDRSPDKQSIFANAVSYAHERDMLIVAEGVETYSELLTVMEIGADLLQGYLVGKPLKEPVPILDSVVNTIQQYRKKLDAKNA